MAVAAALLRAYGADSGSQADVTALTAAAITSDDPRTECVGHLLRGLTQACEHEWADAVDSLHAAARAGRDLGDLDLLTHLGNAALHLGDHDTHTRCYTAMLAGAREAGAVMQVLYGLARLGFSQIVAGEWTALRRVAEEALTLSASVGQQQLGAAALGWLTLLAALEGRPDTDYATLLAHLQRASEQQLGVLADPVHDLLRWAQGVQAANEGDAATALHHLGRLRVITIARVAAVDRLDAAARAGDRELAETWIDDLAEFAHGTGWPWARGAVDFGRALLAEPADAADHFAESLASYEGAGRPYDAARVHLAYGEHLRRAQHRVEARDHLRAALTTFEDLRVEPLISRAARELRASGETARRRGPSTQIALTPMERQVAALATTGLSNKDIAAQCWISPRTVAFHLRNIFAKAGITSRGELTRLQLG
jgi:DNA-binding CsgD family transcriptional regulator